MFAIKNDVLALKCALWYNTIAYCVTRHVKLLVPVLSKPFVIIMFGIQLV